MAQQAAQLLRENFEAQRLVLLGSLAQEEGFVLWSDIDLAAWGIPAERFFAAVAAVTGLSPDFKIDLIDPDTCRPSLRAAIERDGVELWIIKFDPAKVKNLVINIQNLFVQVRVELSAFAEFLEQRS